jgi:hypothetical protein
MMRKFLVLITILFSINACDDTITVDNLDKKVIPTSNVSFSQDIYPIFQVKCAYSGCHSGSSPAGEIDLTSWVNVTAYPDVVYPGDPSLSRLVWAIEGTAGISRMPPTNTGLVLTPDQIQGIKTWIKEGAKDN